MLHLIDHFDLISDRAKALQMQNDQLFGRTVPPEIQSGGYIGHAAGGGRYCSATVLKLPLSPQAVRNRCMFTPGIKHRFFVAALHIEHTHNVKCRVRILKKHPIAPLF